VFLACADTSIAVHDLQNILSEFSANAAEMHRDHINGMMNTLHWTDALNGTPVIKHPIGVPIGIGSGMRMTVQHDAEKAEQEKRRWKEVREWTEFMRKRLNSKVGGSAVTMCRNVSMNRSGLKTQDVSRTSSSE